MCIIVLNALSSKEASWWSCLSNSLPKLIEPLDDDRELLFDRGELERRLLFDRERRLLSDPERRLLFDRELRLLSDPERRLLFDRERRLLSDPERRLLFDRERRLLSDPERRLLFDRERRPLLAEVLAVGAATDVFAGAEDPALVATSTYCWTR